MSKIYQQLDPWQKEVDEYDGNICLRSGRQVGKSFIISKKAGDYAAKNKKVNVLIIASVERQSFLMLEKVLAYLEEYYPKLIKKGKDKPTKTRIKLINGSVIYSLPTGLTGYGIRGFTIHMLIADEAAFIPEAVWTAVTPMLATTDSRIILLSTPHGKGGYYYECFSDPNFRAWHISSEDCPRIKKEFLEREKQRMSEIAYAQEYLGEFIDDLRRIFSDELIAKCCVLKRPENLSRQGKYFLGCDLAGLGGDENSFEVLYETANIKNLIQVENVVTKKKLSHETSNFIASLNKVYNFGRRCIGIDDGGVGFGVFSNLMNDDLLKRKVVALNNSSRDVDYSGEKSKKLLKEEMYFNLLALMEGSKIKLLDDDNLIESLRSIQYELVIKENQKTSYRIFGRYSHITEGLIRAAWIASKNKSLNIYIV